MFYTHFYSVEIKQPIITKRIFQNKQTNNTEIMTRFILLFAVAVFTLTSCENVQDNQTAVQAMVDDASFNALYAIGNTSEDGSVTIETSSNSRVIKLHLGNTNANSFDLNGAAGHYATYRDTNGNVYTTQGTGTGSVEITDRCASCGTIAGRFDFMAVMPGIDTVYVNNGMFVDVVVGGQQTEVATDSDGTFSALIDSGSFSPVVVNAIDTGNYLLVEGQKGGSSLIVRVPITAAAGDYNLTSGGFAATMIEGLITQNANNGSITILSHNRNAKTMKATFAFEVGATTISQGVFEVRY